MTALPDGKHIGIQRSKFGDCATFGDLERNLCSGFLQKNRRGVGVAGGADRNGVPDVDRPVRGGRDVTGEPNDVFQHPDGVCFGIAHIHRGANRAAGRAVAAKADVLVVLLRGVGVGYDSRVAVVYGDAACFGTHAGNVCTVRVKYPCAVYLFPGGNDISVDRHGFFCRIAERNAGARVRDGQNVGVTVGVRASFAVVENFVGVSVRVDRRTDIAVVPYHVCSNAVGNGNFRGVCSCKGRKHRKHGSQQKHRGKKQRCSFTVF